jgi:hypothetical protein
MQFAPRISPRLLASVVRLARSPLTPAEITRRLGAEAGRRGLPRPCYEQVRVLVRQARRTQQRAVGLALELTLDVAVRASVPAEAQRLVALPLRLLPKRR